MNDKQETEKISQRVKLIEAKKVFHCWWKQFCSKQDFNGLLEEDAIEKDNKKPFQNVDICKNCYPSTLIW